MKFPEFKPVDFLLFIVLSLLLVGAVSFILSSLVPSIPIVQVGVPFLLISVILAVILPFIFVIKDGKLDKGDIGGILLYALLILGIVLFLPKLLPQFFQGVPNLLDSINIFNSVIGLS